MDFNSGQLISRNIVHEIPVTDVVIKAVKNIAYQQGFKSLKFKNRNGVIYHDGDWIVGVDYDDPDDYDDDIKNEDEDYDNDEEDKDKDQLEQYEELEEQLKHINPEEIKEIIRDARGGETNPSMHRPNDNANKEQPEHPVEQQEAPAESTRRSTQETRPSNGWNLK
jgi:NAD+--asparagine ADP-ribosyltransferase